MNKVNYYSLNGEISDWLKKTTFSQFCDALSQRVIGQDNLFLLLANVYNYHHNIDNNQPINHNMLLTAPSGTGKTETYRALKEYFGEHIPSLPVYIKDVSAITITGFKGGEPSSILSPLLDKGFNQPIGLVFLDEFDKKMMPVFDSHGTNVNQDAQFCLLTIIEGSDVEVKVQRNTSIINTEKLMFIGLGSFDFCRERKELQSKSIGFNMDEDEYDYYSRITREDMIEAGGAYELIGRFPLIVNFDRLSYDAVDSIIDKTISILQNTYDCEIELADDMRAELHQNANGKFGCRLISSMLVQNIVNQYAQAMLEGYKEKKVLVIIISSGKCSYRFRDYNQDELELVANYEEIVRNLMEEHSKE